MKTPDNSAGQLTDRIMEVVDNHHPEIETTDYNRIYSKVYKEMVALEKLTNLTDALVADVMSMSDDEIMADAIEDYGSEEAVTAAAESIRINIQLAIYSRQE